MTRNTYTDITLPEAKALAVQPGSVLVDVREIWEFEEFSEGGLNIPLAEIRQKRDLLDPYKSIIVICTNGVRSKVAALDYCRVPTWMDKRIFHVEGGLLESK